MANEYITQAELLATLSLTGETFANDDIDAARAAASRAIDQMCNRRFWKDTASQTRYYTAQSAQMCRIDDLADFTSLDTDQNGDGTYEESWTENTDFFFEPLNQEADGIPRTRMVVHPNQSIGWSRYPRGIKVVGKFGWDAVPDEIVQATTILAAKLLQRARQAPFGVVSLGLDSAARIARTDPDVRMLVGPYVRITV